MSLAGILRAIVIGTLSTFVLILPAEKGLSQSFPDSIVSRYDSIQDRHFKSWGNGVESRLKNIESSQVHAAFSLDSTEAQVQNLDRRLRELLDLQRDQALQLDSLSLALQQTRNTAREIRKNFRRILWITIGILTVLWLASFALLFFRSLKTRVLLMRLRKKQKQTSMKLGRLIKKLKSRRGKPGKRTIRKEVRRTVRRELGKRG